MHVEHEINEEKVIHVEEPPTITETPGHTDAPKIVDTPHEEAVIEEKMEPKISEEVRSETPVQAAPSDHREAHDSPPTTRTNHKVEVDSISHIIPASTEVSNKKSKKKSELLEEIKVLHRELAERDEMIGKLNRRIDELEKSSRNQREVPIKSPSSAEKKIPTSTSTTNVRSVPASDEGFNCHQL